MGITRTRHFHSETTPWKENGDFWVSLGFSPTDRRGSEGHRSGPMGHDQANLVMTQIADLPGVVTPIFSAHWDTGRIRIAVPGGPDHARQERS